MLSLNPCKSNNQQYLKAIKDFQEAKNHLEKFKITAKTLDIDTGKIRKETLASDSLKKAINLLLEKRKILQECRERNKDEIATNYYFSF